jgi:hypothetical protein
MTLAEAKHLAVKLQSDRFKETLRLLQWESPNLLREAETAAISPESATWLRSQCVRMGVPIITLEILNRPARHRAIGSKLKPCFNIMDSHFRETDQLS